LAALLRQLQALAQRQPVLMIFEDLHWIDPASREVLDLTVEKITGLPVLLVATYRPEFQSPWVGGSQVTVIALNRLGRGEGATLKCWRWRVRTTRKGSKVETLDHESIPPSPRRAYADGGHYRRDPKART
jgi:hypothetical protein